MFEALPRINSLISRPISSSYHPNPIPPMPPKTHPHHTKNGFTIQVQRSKVQRIPDAYFGLFASYIYLTDWFGKRVTHGSPDSLETPPHDLSYRPFHRLFPLDIPNASAPHCMSMMLVQIVHHHSISNGKRQQIPNVPAIYFIKPTQRNLDIVANDMKSILYDKFYLNFSSNLERKNLEYLANELIATNSCHRLTKIYDQYIHYTSLSPHLFSLNMTNCYQTLYPPSSSDDIIQHIQQKLTEIADSLFCVIATLQTIPIIRAQKGDKITPPHHSFHYGKVQSNTASNLNKTSIVKNIHSLHLSDLHREHSNTIWSYHGDSEVYPPIDAIHA